MKILFLLKMYQLFHSCEDNPEIVIIVLIPAESKLWRRKKNIFFSSTEYTPAIAGGSFHLPKSILPWKDWTEYPNVLMLLFPSLFLNRLPQVALHSLWTSANFSLKMSCLCTGDNGRWLNRRLNRRHDTCVLISLYIRLDALWLT